MTTITSPSNDRVKDVVRLQRQSSERRKTARFCVEYQRDLQRAIAGGFRVAELYHCPAMGPGPAEIEAATLIEVSEPVLRKIAYRENPEGFVAVVEARSRSFDAIDLEAGPPLIVVCSGVEKPGNLGAVLRSADAAGAAAVFVDSPDFDLYNPNCIRASTGAVFGLPVIRESPTALRDWLKANDVLMLAATPEAKLTYLSLNLRGPTALIVGAEAQGLSPFWHDAADLGVSIPMNGRAADSLNVSVTAAVLLFEAMRQRTG